MTADAATTGGLVVLGRDEVAAALERHALRERGRVYDTCVCGWYGSNHAAHVAGSLVARGRPVAEVVAGALREAASDPALRLSGHSGVSVKGLRALAALVEQEAER